MIAGRTVRVSVRVEYMSELLRVAVEAGFDWVYYASQSYVRLSVIPDGKLVNCLSPSLFVCLSLSLSLSLYLLSLSISYYSIGT